MWHFWIHTTHIDFELKLEVEFRRNVFSFEFAIIIKQCAIQLIHPPPFCSNCVYTVRTSAAAFVQFVFRFHLHILTRDALLNSKEYMYIQRAYAATALLTDLQVKLKIRKYIEISNTYNMPRVSSVIVSFRKVYIHAKRWLFWLKLNWQFYSVFFFVYKIRMPKIYTEWFKSQKCRTYFEIFMTHRCIY